MKRLIVIAALVLTPPAAAHITRHSPRPRGVAWHSAAFAVRGVNAVATATLPTPEGLAFAAWIDHTRTRLALYPGSLEPPAAPLRGPTEIPTGERWRLLATFNGGFKAAAGAGGMAVNGIVESPFRTGMGTLVEYRDGTLAILDWLGRTSPRTLVLARQNLPPLVWDGRPSTLALFAQFLWGATLGGGAAVWRSGVGVTQQGDLVYAAGDGQTPASLAQTLVRLGAIRAIELDINPQWPTFITYQHRGGRDPVKLVPNPQQGPYRYLTSDTRDFFAVYTRAGGANVVPLR